MKPKDRQKICTHCDGRIAMEADSCPYCGMPLIKEVEEMSPSFSQENRATQDKLSSLYPPPYSNRSFPQPAGNEQMSRFKTPQAPMEDAFAKVSMQNKENSHEEEKAGFTPLLLVLVGSNLLTLGLLQGMFSEGGFLRLEWNSQHWFWYCLFALPLIYIGMKKVKQAQDPS